MAGRSAHLPTVLAVDAARRFLLMEAFAGEPLAAPGDVGAWTAAAQAYGELQRQCLDAVDELRAPLDHGDLWPSNVLVGPAGCAFVDWEDVRVAHPFLSLFQLLTGAYLDRRFADHDAAAARIRDAYLAGGSARAGRAELARAFDAAHDVAAVAVAASYRRYPPAVVQAHPWMREMPALCLSRILARRARQQAFANEPLEVAGDQRLLDARAAQPEPARAASVAGARAAAPMLAPRSCSTRSGSD